MQIINKSAIGEATDDVLATAIADLIAEASDECLQLTAQLLDQDTLGAVMCALEEVYEGRRS